MADDVTELRGGGGDDSSSPRRLGEAGRAAAVFVLVLALRVQAALFAFKVHPPWHYTTEEGPFDYCRFESPERDFHKLCHVRFTAFISADACLLCGFRQVPVLPLGCNLSPASPPGSFSSFSHSLHPPLAVQHLCWAPILCINFFLFFLFFLPQDICHCAIMVITPLKFSALSSFLLEPL